MKRQWTPQQLKAILNEKGTDLLVSASAGSGKTSSMVERALTLLKKGVPLERILMLTFSEKAATEIRERLTSALLGYALESADDRDFIREQIDDLPTAHITTIDSFCRSVVKDGFELIEGLSPSFGVCDEVTTLVLKEKTSELLLKQWEEKEDPTYLRLLDIFSLRDDDNLIDLISTLYNHITVQVNRGGWLDNVYAHYVDEKGFEEIGAVKRFVKETRETFSEFAQTLNRFLIDVEGVEKPNHFGERCEYLRDIILPLSQTTSAKDIYKCISTPPTHKWGTVYTKEKDEYPCFKTLVEYKEEIVKCYEKVKEACGTLSYEDALSDHAETMKLLGCIIEMTKDYDKIFSELKRKDNLLDFADMDYFASIVLQNIEKKEEIKSRFDYLFIDEYQDTSYIQDEVLGSVAKENSLYMVGDVKQCIYRFRLAEPSIFSQKYESYSIEDKAIDFKDNFRSDSRILSFVNDIFNEVMTKEFGQVDYRNTSAFNLRAPHPVSDYPPVQVCIIPTKEEEGEDSEIAKGVYSVKNDSSDSTNEQGRKEGLLVASLIRDIVGKVDIIDEKGVLRKVEYEDIAVMARDRKAHIHNVVKELSRQDIPLDSSNISADTRSLEIALMIDLLSLIDNGRQDYPLISVMRSPIGKFSDSELATIKIQDGGYSEFFTAVEKVSTQNSPLGKKVSAFLAFLEKYRFKATFTGVKDLALDLLEETGLKDSVLSLENGYTAYLSLLNFFHSFDAEAMRSLSAFVNYVTKYGDFKTSGDNMGEKGVKIITMHASKGLEYPVVILVGCGRKLLNGRSKGYVVHKDYGIGIKTYRAPNRQILSNIIYASIKDQKEIEEKEDAMRLFYVALTRARSHLILTGERDEDTSLTTPKKAVTSLDWIYYCAEKKPELKKLIKICNPEEVSGKDNKGDDKETKIPQREDKMGYQSAIDGLNWKYPYEESSKVGIKYSVTAINTVESGENLPRLFTEEEKILKGVEYHKILQYIDLSAQSEEEIKSELKRLFDAGIISQESFEEANLGDLLNCLNSPIMQYAKTREVKREQKFMISLPVNRLQNTTAEDKVLLQGVIDLLIIDREKGEAIVVDFKRSKAPAEILKERYKKQLELYKLAVEEIYHLKVSKTLLYVIGQNLTVEIN